MHLLKTGFGRPAEWYGVTPLMIYRSVSGWLPQPNNSPETQT
jgi:hypothetical protein